MRPLWFWTRSPNCLEWDPAANKWATGAKQRKQHCKARVDNKWALFVCLGQRQRKMFQEKKPGGNVTLHGRFGISDREDRGRKSDWNNRVAIKTGVLEAHSPFSSRLLLNPDHQKVKLKCLPPPSDREEITNKVHRQTFLNNGHKKKKKSCNGNLDFFARKFYGWALFFLPLAPPLQTLNVTLATWPLVQAMVKRGNEAAAAAGKQFPDELELRRNDIRQYNNVSLYSIVLRKQTRQ